MENIRTEDYKATAVMLYNNFVKRAAINTGFNLSFLLIKNPTVQKYLGSCRTINPDMRDDTKRDAPEDLHKFFEEYKRILNEVYKLTHPEYVEKFESNMDGVSIYKITAQSEDILDSISTFFEVKRKEQDDATKEEVGRFDAKYYPDEKAIFVDAGRKRRFSSLYRELTKVLCTQVKATELRRCGFETPRFGQSTLGVGLQKGYLEWFTQKHFNKLGYLGKESIEFHFARLLEQIVGEEPMENMFINSDFPGLVDELAYYYGSDYDHNAARLDVINLFQQLDEINSKNRACLTGKNGYNLYLALACIYATNIFQMVKDTGSPLFFNGVNGFINQVPPLSEDNRIDKEQRKRMYDEVCAHIQYRFHLNSEHRTIN